MQGRAERPVRVAIIGAGIGGLTAAHALRQRGIEVDIHERAAELTEVGAGLQIGANAFKVLRALGLEQATRRATFEPARQTTLNWDDASLRARVITKGVYDSKYGAPHLTALRSDLHQMLRETLPANIIHLGKTCTAAGTAGQTAFASFADGTQIEADAVIAADGLRSVIRGQMFGAEAPQFTNYVAWRCMIDINEVPAWVGPGGSVELRRDEYISWYGPTGQVICYPVGDGSRLNVFAGRSAQDWVDESWSIPSSREELLAAYQGWNPALLRMLEKVEHCFKWGLFGREPRTEWTLGRVTLLGDAAHPTMPNLAQGAAMAIEDGYVLARHLAREPVELALHNYARERAPRTARITTQSRENFRRTMELPPRPPIDREWIFEFDATAEPADAVA